MSSRWGRLANIAAAAGLVLAVPASGAVTPRREPVDLPAAIDHFLSLPAPARGLKTIVFTADSMRRTRAHLGLTS